MNEIDFVILWVDGNDPAWREEFVRTRQAENDDASEIRYRDWRNLHYWFRSAERFAPWVRKVHFITWGHLPAWLRRDHPKLHIVNHRDFIPAEYLPTFNSNTIELNIHRIEGLADRFVLFNDDTFLTRGCRPEDFFRRGVPCDMARLSVVQPSSVGHIIYNDLELINRLHDKRTAIRNHIARWFSPRYGIVSLLKTLTLLPWGFFPGFNDSHMPQPYLTERFRQAWERWPRELDASCRHRIRSLSDPLARPLRHAGFGSFRTPLDGRLPVDDPHGRLARKHLPRHRTATLADDLPERQRADFRLRAAEPLPVRCFRAHPARKVGL